MEEQTKMLAFLSKLIHKIAIEQPINENEIQSLENIMNDLGSHELSDDEFRY